MRATILGTLCMKLNKIYQSFHSEFSLIGLALIALGTGLIKPCVSSFGGDQFKLPEQEKQLKVIFQIDKLLFRCSYFLVTHI